MAIKSDAWILRMCEEHNLIAPFERTLIRQVEERRIISCGLSSYGYDCRLAKDEFKVFSPIQGTEINPKNFNPKNLLDIPIREDADGGLYWLLPPHSYALGVTIESFIMPRNVTAIALGKSTYARCFRGDTRVALVDGSAPTLEDMARRADNGEMFWGYSVGEHGRIEVTLLDAPRFIGRDSLLRVALDNGEMIDCTPDHVFIRRDGSTVTAGELRPGHSLMPLYRKLARGYEVVYQPINGHLYPTHRLADEWNIRNGLYEDVPGTHRHHVDENRTNNIPWNLVRMDTSEHIRYHNERSCGEEFDPTEHSPSIRAALEELKRDDQWFGSYSRVQSEPARRFWDDEFYAEARERLRAFRRVYWAEQRARQERFWENHPERRWKTSARFKKYWENAGDERRDQQREIARQMNTRFEITEARVCEALDQTGSIRGAARLFDCDRTVFHRFRHVLQELKGVTVSNHKVVAVEELKGDHDVYCLTVPEAGNFALAAGVFVHNCGLIQNTTPLEADWRGRLVVELYNAANLPVRLYAEEGFVQILFFESDEACLTSYRDRAGKYQNQTGLTLAKL